jgi:hypothetical protein
MLALLLVLLNPGEWSDQKPPALLAMEGARAAWSQTDVEWTYNSKRSPRIMHYRNRYGEGEWIGTMLGDQDGFGYRDEDGTLERALPDHWLLKADGSIWQHQQTCPGATLFDAATARHLGTPDLRNIGLNHIPSFIDPWQDYSSRIWKPDTPVLYRQTTGPDGKVIVEARTDAPRTSVRRWILDPGNDFQPVRLEMVSPEDGAVTEAVDVTYQTLPNGSRFLDSVTYSSKGREYARVKVLKARVNDPSLPRTFRPEDIDIDDGMDLSLMGVAPPASATPGFPVCYCQGEIIDVWQMGERIRSGAVKLGRNTATAQAKAEMGLDWRQPWPEDLDTPSEPLPLASQPSSRPLTDWEKYTLDFIQRYNLDDEQSQKALSILKQCQDRRRSIEAIHRQSEGAKNEHIEWIFSKVLKPRLERLPTRRQRAEAEQVSQEGRTP